MELSGTCVSCSVFHIFSLVFRWFHVSNVFFYSRVEINCTVSKGLDWRASVSIWAVWLPSEGFLIYITSTIISTIYFFHVNKSYCTLFSFCKRNSTVSRCNICSRNWTTYKNFSICIFTEEIQDLWMNIILYAWFFVFSNLCLNRLHVDQMLSAAPAPTSAFWQASGLWLSRHSSQLLTVSCMWGHGRAYYEVLKRKGIVQFKGFIVYSLYQ